MKSRSPWILGIAVAMLLVADLAVAGDEIGIYFDEGGTANCIADNLFTPVPAYITILEPTATGGVKGWEGTLGFDEDLYVSVAQFYGNCINVGQFPEFAVGLASPLPITGPVVVARLSVFATAPGGLWFGPSSRPSIPGATSPIYLGADQVLRPMAPVSSAPLAIIGYGDCGPHAPLDSIPNVGDTSLVFASDTVTQDPDLVARFYHGEESREFGYEESPEGVAGVYDFDVGADGSIYILDSINNRMVVLNQDLNWSEEVPIGKGFVTLKEANGIIYLTNRANLRMELQRTKAGWDAVTHVIEPGDTVPKVHKTEAALEVVGARVSPTLIHISGQYALHKTPAPAFSWDLQLPRPYASIAPTIDELVHGGLVLTIAYGESNIPEKDIRVTSFGSDGAVLKTVCPPTTIGRNYRLPFTTRAGLDGSIVSVLVYDTYTEVVKWRR